MSGAKTARLVLIVFAMTTLLVLSFGSSSALAQDIIPEDLTGGLTAEDLVDILLGPDSCATVSDISFTGDNRAAGAFTGGTGIVGFESGIMLSSGQVVDVVGPNALDNTTTSFGTAGDPDLQTLIPGYTTWDAAVLEFDFECPSSSTPVFSFRYVFTSEEYNEYVNTPYNNVFGFFLNGTNIALLPDGVTPVAINNVNGGNPLGTDASNPAFYINNDCSDSPCTINIEADGLTAVLGAESSISPSTNHIKLAISDAGDSILDSWVFLEGGSFQCAPLASLSPPTLTAELYPGESVFETKTVFVPPRPPMADVVFAFDLTGSMGDIIDTAKTQAANIIAQLNALSGVEIQYGVMSYMDYPSYPDTYDSCDYSAIYGSADYGDYAYSLDQAVTNNSAAVVAAIGALTLGNGWDGPQDYTRIFYESYADPAVSWRDGAKRILVNFGDNVPHDCNLNEGVPGKTGTYSTGGDPGRNEIMGDGDDLDLQTVLTDMGTNGVVLLEAHTTTSMGEYWDHWTGLTGGSRFVTTSSTLVDDIVAAVEAALEAPMVYGLHLEAGGGYDPWLFSSPPDQDVDPGECGDSVQFDIEISVPDGTPPGVNNFIISALDEVWVSYGEQDVTITVLNHPPVAMCTDPVIEAGEGCEADGSVDNGSYDPDGDATTITEVPPPPYPLGDTLVTLTIEDVYGAAGSCDGTVSVVDTTPPEAFCNSPPTIIPPDAPIAFTSTTSDYCGSTVVITGYDCWAINGAGKRISKLESCVVSFAGDTITIDDSGGIGDHIDWVVIATDSSGNTNEITCSVEVVKKPKN